MEKGQLIGARLSLKWLPEGGRLFMGWVVGGQKVGTKPGFWGRPKVTGRNCVACQKIILDVAEG